MSLIETAQLILDTPRGSFAQEQLVRLNPAAMFVTVNYSYYQELGSDGCWGETRNDTCILRDWLNGKAQCKGGNRDYNYRVINLTGDEGRCLDLHREAQVLAARQAEAGRLASIERTRQAKELRERLDGELRQLFKGAKVVVGGKQGTVERSMVSRFDATKTCALVSFGPGKQSWHLFGAIKRAAQG